MFITALCPTFRHTDLLENSLELWNRQDYPADQRYLIIHDDGETYPNQEGPNWRLYSTQRYQGLPMKYNFMRHVAPPQTDVFAIWEDDDIYCEKYLSKHAEQLKTHELSKPGIIMSDYSGPGTLLAERGDGRFSSSLAFRKELVDRIGGITNTKRKDYDLHFIQALFKAATSHGDPSPTIEECEYIMGWFTGKRHGQNCGTGPADENWYEDAAKRYDPVESRPSLIAKLDSRTEKLLAAKEAKRWVDHTRP